MWNFISYRYIRFYFSEFFGGFSKYKILTVVSVVVILKFRNVALNIGLFIVLLLGSYGMIRGILEILYSLKLQRRKSNNVKIEIDHKTCVSKGFLEIIEKIGRNRKINTDNNSF